MLKFRFHTRTHHPEIPCGVWRLAVNGLQVFVGRYAVTFHWNYGSHNPR